jgi:hypothetical protein
MRKVFVVLATLLLAGTVHAATLSYVGQLTFGLATLPGASAAGGGVYVGPTHVSTITFAASAFGPVNVSLPVTNNATIQSVRISNLANLAGVMTGISGGPPGGGPMGLSGMAKICLIFAPCPYAQVPVPLGPTAATGMGVGGTQAITGGVSITMQHSGWTIGQPTMTIHTPSTTITSPALPGGFAHGPATGTTSTASPSGMLQLVTVSKVYTSLSGAFPELPVFAALTLQFVPEPGTLLLLGAGVVGLAIIGRKRSRK